MARKRDYIEEILTRKDRHLIRAPREDQFRLRVYPLVKGFRAILALDSDVDYKNEWLKYGAIGYIACIEGYFRMLFSDLINAGPPYSNRISGFKDIKINIEDLVAIHSKTVSLGEYISHLLPMNGVNDINGNMTTLIGQDYFNLLKASPTNLFNPDDKRVVGETFPEIIGNVEALFQLRHLYCHELAPKVKTPTRKVVNLISSAASLVTYTEDIAQKILLKTAEQAP